MRRRISLVLAMRSPPACALEFLQRRLCKVVDLAPQLVVQRRALLQLEHQALPLRGELAQQEVPQGAHLRHRHLLIEVRHSRHQRDDLLLVAVGNEVLWLSGLYNAGWGKTVPDRSATKWLFMTLV